MYTYSAKELSVVSPFWVCRKVGSHWSHWAHVVARTLLEFFRNQPWVQSACWLKGVD